MSSQPQRALASQVPANQPAAAIADAPAAPSRTQQLVGGLDGYAAQQAALSPRGAAAKAPDATNTTTTAQPTDAGAPDTAALAGPEALSPLRQALLQQFQALNGKGVGDAEFEAICGEQWWKDRQKSEADAKVYNKDVWPGEVAKWEQECKANPEYAKTHKKPPRKDDSHFTTCIATQTKLLEAAFKATQQHVKQTDAAKFDMFTYGTLGRLEATKRGAWVEAKPGMPNRPQPGDILVLEMRGSADKVQGDIDGENSQYSMYSQNVKSIEKKLAEARAASQSATEAISKAGQAKVPQLEARLQELKAAHDKRLQELDAKLAEARAKTAATAGTEKALKGGNRMGGLEFSHVGFFNGLRPETDADGKPTGRELWTTFDGGAHVPGKVDNQGAKSGLRIYDPRTNEIMGASQGKGGAVTQDGKTRWLGGWTNVDALVDASRPPPAPK